MKWDQCFAEICGSLFKISISFGSTKSWGTGFMVAKYKNPDKLALVLATAKHVVSFPENETVQWDIKQLDWHGNIKRILSFKSNNALMKASPIRVHTDLDIGAVFIPKFGDVLEDRPLRTICSSYAIQPGAKVGWAGFPALTSYKTLSDRPCYFEGVISSVVDQGSRLYYIIDGHSELAIYHRCQIYNHNQAYSYTYSGTFFPMFTWVYSPLF
ncbi:hypothetical protein ACFLVW_06510 [Chloroflexota bacterium]